MLVYNYSTMYYLDTEGGNKAYKYEQKDMSASFQLRYAGNRILHHFPNILAQGAIF